MAAASLRVGIPGSNSYAGGAKSESRGACGTRTDWATWREAGEYLPSQQTERVLRRRSVPMALAARHHQERPTFIITYTDILVIILIVTFRTFSRLRSTRPTGRRDDRSRGHSRPKTIFLWRGATRARSARVVAKSIGPGQRIRHRQAIRWRAKDDLTRASATLGSRPGCRESASMLQRFISGSF